MKRIMLLFTAVVLLLAGSAAADQVDLSGMSFDQLVSLRDQLNLAIWNSQEWQEVTVPSGTWEVGEDIPEGHWTITVVDGAGGNYAYTDVIDKYGKEPGPKWQGISGILNATRKRDGSYYFPFEDRSVDIKMEDGMFFINTAPVIFTPYAGKPDLGFK